MVREEREDEKAPNTYRHTNTPAGAPDLHDMVKKGFGFLTSVATDAVEAVQQVSDSLTAGTAVRLEEAIGKQGEVSAPIEVGGTGEVIFSLGGSTHHSPARAKDQRRAFKKGQKVKIVDSANNTLFVE
jgi:membrane protein implicated in regulation of membrane protease activity